MRKKQFSYFSFQIFFGFWVKSFSDFRPKNFKKLTKLTSARPEDYFVTLNFFKKFWTVLDFLQKPLVWFSKIYLSAQSINCGCNSFFVLLFRIFSNFEQIIFRLLAKKLREFVKTTFYVSRGTLCGLIFFKFWNFGIFCRNIWHGSQNSIYVSRVKIAEKTVFFVSFQNFFEFWAKIFQTFGHKTSKSFQNYLRVQRNSLWLEIFF